MSFLESTKLIVENEHLKAILEVREKQLKDLKEYILKLEFLQLKNQYHYEL